MLTWMCSLACCCLFCLASFQQVLVQQDEALRWAKRQSTRMIMQVDAQEVERRQVEATQRRHEEEFARFTIAIQGAQYETAPTLAAPLAVPTHQSGLMTCAPLPTPHPPSDGLVDCLHRAPPPAVRGSSRNGTRSRSVWAAPLAACQLVRQHCLQVTRARTHTHTHTQVTWAIALRLSPGLKQAQCVRRSPDAWAQRWFVTPPGAHLGSQQ